MNPTPPNNDADGARVSFPVGPEMQETIARLFKVADQAPDWAARAERANQDLASLQFGRLHDYFGIWAMEQQTFLAGFEHIKRTNLQVHIQQVKLENQKSGGEKAEGSRQKAEGEDISSGSVHADSGDGGAASLPYSVIGVTKSGIAVVDVSGALMKYESSVTSSTSTVMLRRTMRALAKNPDVTAVMLKIDSPGGTVSGTSDLADDVAALAAVKPVAAYVEDLTASAAYWIASQVGSGGISAGKNSLVGSIGTYGVVEDSSAAAAMAGIKVHVVKAGAFKGSGVEGTAVTAEQLAEVQRIVDSLNQDFLEGVSKGRRMGMEQVKAIADGRVHKAPEALKLGLIDQVESFDAAMGRLEGRIQNSAVRNQGGQKGATRSEETGGGCSAAEIVTPARVEGPERKECQMTPDSNTPAGTIQAGAGGGKIAATIAQLEAAFSDDPHFALQQAKAGATFLEAQAAYALVLQAKLQNRDEELEKLRGQQTSQPPNVQQPRTGLRPLGSRVATTAIASQIAASTGGKGKLGPNVMAFNDAVKEKMNLLKCDRRAAVVAVASEDPDLHRAYLEETNPNPKSRALIEDRFAGMA